ncbi:MAG: tryptophan--tRNA ligase [bacterium]|nr:tryptophan--tRNA ligase [bacterium]MCS7310210.1 tryptophan--tRNA ligase [Armatimonadota bacterium]
MSKARLLSGMQPTGVLHLGNLEGALRNWVQLQDQYDSYFCIVDWHALTTLAERTEEIPHNVREVAIDYIAAGLDPEKCAIFVQSHVKEHAELHLLFSMITPLGWLERVPTYKEKRENLQLESVSYGLLGYPVLQAADILVYKAQVVPVGEDQLPHLELTREVARRFNYLYGEVFPEPQALLTPAARVPGLDGRKMSKSYNNAIYLSDDAQTVTQKVKQAFTDPQKVRKNDPGHPEGCVVFALHQIYSKDDAATIETECRAGQRGCVDCKMQLAGNLNTALDPLRQRRQELLAKAGELERILREGAEKARAVAQETMKEVRAAMHLE